MKNWISSFIPITELTKNKQIPNTMNRLIADKKNRKKNTRFLRLKNVNSISVAQPRNQENNHELDAKILELQNSIYSSTFFQLPEIPPMPDTSKAIKPGRYFLGQSGERIAIPPMPTNLRNRDLNSLPIHTEPIQKPSKLRQWIHRVFAF